MANEDTYESLSEKEKEEAVFKEMLPFALIAFIPISITITLALVFGPSL